MLKYTKSTHSFNYYLVYMNEILFPWSCNLHLVYLFKYDHILKLHEMKNSKISSTSPLFSFFLFFFLVLISQHQQKLNLIFHFIILFKIKTRFYSFSQNFHTLIPNTQLIIHQRHSILKQKHKPSTIRQKILQSVS